MEYASMPEEPSVLEDDSVHAERDSIRSLSVLHDNPLVVKDICKKY